VHSSCSARSFASIRPFISKIKLQITAAIVCLLNNFSSYYRKIVQQAGVDVHLFTHEEHHDTPDAVFPNNWFSTHPDLECRGTSRNTLVLYPMKVPNRRKERRPDIIARLHE